MPVIKHFAGNCHVYVDKDADLEMAERMTINSKCQRQGVCNACESLLVHADVGGAVPAPYCGGPCPTTASRLRGDRRTVECLAECGASHGGRLLRGVPGAGDFCEGGRLAGGGD